MRFTIRAFSVLMMLASSFSGFALANQFDRIAAKLKSEVPAPAVVMELPAAPASSVAVPVASLPNAVAPACKPMGAKALASALALADRSLSKVAELTLSRAITAEVAERWVRGDKALDPFFARSSEIALRGPDAKFAVRAAIDAADRAGGLTLREQHEIRPDSDTDLMPVPRLLIVNRRRVAEMIRAIPAAKGSNEDFLAALADVRDAGREFINSTTPLLSHYNCAAMPAPKAEASLWNPGIPSSPSAGEEAAPPEPAQSARSGNNARLYSSPTGASFEGGSSSSGAGGSRSVYEGGSSSSGAGAATR